MRWATEQVISKLATSAVPSVPGSGTWPVSIFVIDMLAELELITVPPLPMVARMAW